MTSDASSVELVSDPILEAWEGILGPGSDPALGFLDNGGDSFKAVTLSARLFELTGIEVDFMDVLEVMSIDGLRSLFDTLSDSA